MKRKVTISFLILCLMLIFVKTNCEASTSKSSRIEHAKNAVIKIQTVLKTYEGKTYCVKESCGFVICNKTGNVYIVTTNHGVIISEKEKKAICKKYKLDISSGLSTEIQIMVEGDVVSTVSVKANSSKDNFCILEANDVLEKRGVLCVEDVDKTEVGEKVYVVGLKKESMGNSAYEQSDVEIHVGDIEDASATMQGNTYIQHSAVLDEGASGGALLNKDGYLIGMNDFGVLNTQVQTYYAIPISKIQAVLDNYGISYDSKKKTQAWKEFSKLYLKCNRLSKMGKYTQASVEILQNAIEKTSSLEQNKNASVKEIYEAQKILENGKKQLKPKMAKIKIVQYILGAILFAVAIHLLWTILHYRKIRQAGLKELDSINFAQSAQISTGKDSVDNRVEKVSDNIVVTREADIKNDIQKNEKEIDLENFENEETVKLRKDIETVPFSKEYLADTGQYYEDGASLRNPLTEIEKYISRKSFIIGKNADADFQMTNKAVSRKHAVIKWKEGKYYIQDLDSANGTYVNGKLVHGTLELSNHDIITLADEEIEFILKSREVQL